MKNPNAMQLGGWCKRYCLVDVPPRPFYYQEHEGGNTALYILNELRVGRRPWLPCEGVSVESEFNPDFGSASIRATITQVYPEEHRVMARHFPPAQRRYILLLSPLVNPLWWFMYGSPLHPLSLTHTQEMNDEHEAIRQVYHLEGIDTAEFRWAPVGVEPEVMDF